VTAKRLDTQEPLLKGAKQRNITLGDKERLFGYLEGWRQSDSARTAPGRCLTPGFEDAGWDTARKCPSPYANYITLRRILPRAVDQKIRRIGLPTRRVFGRTDPGEPAKLPGLSVAPGLHLDQARTEWGYSRAAAVLV